MNVAPVKNASVWGSLRTLFMGSMVIFLINIYFGFDNSLTIGEIPRWQVLIHLHGGSIGWITLSAIGIAVWLLTWPILMGVLASREGIDQRDGFEEGGQALGVEGAQHLGEDLGTSGDGGDQGVHAGVVLDLAGGVGCEHPLHLRGVVGVDDGHFDSLATDHPLQLA